MLDLGVVPRILDLLEQHVVEGDVSVQHAGLSALRNLAIPGSTFLFKVLSCYIFFGGGVSKNFLHLSSTRLCLFDQKFSKTVIL